MKSVDSQNIVRRSDTVIQSVDTHHCRELFESSRPVYPWPAYLPGGKLYSSNRSSLGDMRGPHCSLTALSLFLISERNAVGCVDVLDVLEVREELSL